MKTNNNLSCDQLNEQMIDQIIDQVIDQITQTSVKTTIPELLFCKTTLDKASDLNSVTKDLAVLFNSIVQLTGWLKEYLADLPSQEYGLKEHCLCRLADVCETNIRIVNYDISAYAHSNNISLEPVDTFTFAFDEDCIEGFCLTTEAVLETDEFMDDYLTFSLLFKEHERAEYEGLD